MNEFTRETQVLYIPNRADGDESHPDVEAGFVTSTRFSASASDTVFVRYWSKHSPGELRTKANSEGCHPSNLVIKDTVPQSQIDAVMPMVEESEELNRKAMEKYL